MVRSTGSNSKILVSTLQELISDVVKKDGREPSVFINSIAQHFKQNISLIIYQSPDKAYVVINIGRTA